MSDALPDEFVRLLPCRRPLHNELGSDEDPALMEPPETHYTRSGDVNIAYQVLGEGPLDLVQIAALTNHVELVWENPPLAKFLDGLASLGRLLLFDKRGTGMSDRVVGSPTLETRMDDIRAVMDAVESEKVVLIGYYDGGALAVLFAATYPERTSALVLFHALPRFDPQPRASLAGDPGAVRATG
jgi:pimeloyl-ACP methyl ester carboxylesterase